MVAAAERAEAAGFVTVAPPRWLAGCEAWVRRAAPRGAARSGSRLGAGGLEAQVRRPRAGGMREEEEAAEEPAARLSADRARGAPARPEEAGLAGKALRGPAARAEAPRGV